MGTPGTVSDRNVSEEEVEVNGLRVAEQMNIELARGEQALVRLRRIEHRTSR